MKNKYLRCIACILSLTSVVSGFNSALGQCTWHTKLTDGYEYTNACPDVIAGTVYTSVPQTWTAHSGTKALYLNFINWTGTTGTDTGTVVYQRTLIVCPNLPIRISSWLTTTFSGLQCAVHIKILDSNNVVLTDLPNITAPYSPIWVNYQSGSVTPSTSIIKFVLITNVAGSAGGNDLSMDDFLVEECNSLDLGPDTTICNTESLNLDAGSGYTSYLWNTGSTNQVLSASTSLPGFSIISYNVSVTSGVCTFHDTIRVSFDVCSSVNDPLNQNNISVYPNPANDHLVIHSDLFLNDAYITLYDITGREALKTKIESNDQRVSLFPVRSGIYFYIISEGKSKNRIGKLVVNCDKD